MLPGISSATFNSSDEASEIVIVKGTVTLHENMECPIHNGTLKPVMDQLYERYCRLKFLNVFFQFYCASHGQEPTIENNQFSTL